MPGERDALITEHAHLVALTRHLSVRIVPTGVETDDLDSCGYIALVQAADRFDPERGVEFRTLAICMIRGAMLEFLRQADWAPRLVRQAQKRGEDVAIIEVVSLEGLVSESDDEDSLSVSSQVAGVGPDPEELVISMDETRRLWEKVGELSPWERQVIEEHYLLGRTFVSIARRMERSATRIGQIHQDALKHLGADE